MRGGVLHRASPDLNICCANISWVRFYKIGSGSLRKLDCVARAVPTMKAGADFAHPPVGGFVFQKCVVRATTRPPIGETKKPGAVVRPGACVQGD